MTEKLSLIANEPIAQPPPVPQAAPPPLSQAFAAGIPAAAVQHEDEESLAKGIFGGLVGGLLGAVLWAAITAATHFRIGYMAIGVGFLVGFGCRLLGKGSHSTFGIAGATIAGLSCVLGNVLAFCGIGAQEAGVSFVAVLLGLVVQPKLALVLLYEGLGPMDFLFYALAIYAGYRYSFSNLAAEY